MASADYSVGTKVTADVSNFEKGMNKAEKSLKGFSNKLADSINRLGKKGLVGSIANVTLAMGGLTQSFNTVIKFAKDVGKAINECTEAYKGQIIAERALDTAIQNNPFISGESSKALKQFASDMQRVTNYGDEELIPMMTNLVSLGRTESEVMQIMSVAMDMSAGMGISLDIAITQLNATLNGNIGRLGQQNAELKGLTEEELKQGKAIEILGEKFKGLSGATADTSKQLKNIKGDFKEALGQFTLPSSDLWNKFWAGFYEKGIEVINKINAFMDSQIIGKKLANAITEQIARINPADIGGRVDYTRNVLRVIGDNELEALKNYLSGLRSLSAEQEIILKRIKAEEDSRYQSSINAKKEAEEKKKQAVAEEKITTEIQKQEEVAKKKTDWASKLLDQRIEMLETERDSAMQYAEEEGEETYTIWRDYNEKILELKLERLEKEKEKALEEEGLTADDKIKIEEYYDGETKKIYNDLGNFKKKKKGEEKKEEKKTLAEMLGYVKKYAENVKQVFSKIADTIKNVMSNIKNVFSKILDVFKFNPDDALIALLKVEDSILTFFVETLPRLPKFFESALQSVLILFKNLVTNINWEKVQEIINNLVDLIIEYTPDIVTNLLDVIIHVAQALLDGLIRFINNGGWKMILDMLLTIQKRIEDFVTDNIDEIVDTIVAMLPDLVQFLIDSIVSASKTFKKLIKPLIKLIMALIEAVFEVLLSDEVLEAGLDALMGLIEAINEELLPRIAYLIPKLIVKIIGFVVKNLPKLVVGIVEGLIKAFITVNWFDVVKQIFMGFIDGVKDLFGIHSPSTLFESFGEYMIEGLWQGISNLGQWLWDNVVGFFSNLWDGIKNVFSNVGSWFSDAFSGAWKGIKNAWSGVKSWFADIGSGIKDIFSSCVSNMKSAFEKAGNWVKDMASKIGDGLSKTGEAIKDGASWVGNKIKSFFGFANGTLSAPRGLALVGEAGPELIKFRGGEQVLNNRNTNKALENMGGNTNNFNVTFNNMQDTTAFAMLQQLKQYNRQMAINGVI